MVTDPPYGVDYDPEWRHGAGLSDSHSIGQVRNDDRVDWTAAYKLFPGDVAYVWHAGRFAGDLAQNLAAAGFGIRAQIIWRKPAFAISRGQYHWQHEPCWYAVRQGRTSKWVGDRSQSTVWDVSNRIDDRTEHSTQKPIECMARPVQNHGGREDAVYDPFLGSGTTLVACEQLGRRCSGSNSPRATATSSCSAGRRRRARGSARRRPTHVRRHRVTARHVNVPRFSRIARRYEPSLSTSLSDMPRCSAPCTFFRLTGLAC
jgi:DNA modification methylase